MKNKLLCFGLVLVVSMSVISPARAVSLETLKNSLSKFCIASPEACGTITAPIFDTQQNACTCYNSDYQQYDASERKCVIKCPPGTFRREMKASGSCPAGYFLSSNCPSGTRKVLLQKRALKSYEFGGQRPLQSDCKSLNKDLQSADETIVRHPELVSGSIGRTRVK